MSKMLPISVLEMMPPHQEELLVQVEAPIPKMVKMMRKTVLEDSLLVLSFSFSLHLFCFSPISTSFSAEPLQVVKPSKLNLPASTMTPTRNKKMHEII